MMQTHETKREPRARFHSPLALGTCATAGADREVNLVKQSRSINPPGYVRAVLKDGCWRVRYRDPVTGKDTRRRLPVETEDDAREYLREINRSINGDRGAVPAWREPERQKGLTVHAALVESINAAGGCERYKLNSMGAVNAFIKFQEERFPHVRGWADITPGMITAWVKSMQAKPLAFDTVRNSLAPIRAASRYWANEKPKEFRDVVKAAKVKLEQPPRRPEKSLDGEQMHSLLDWLKANHPRVYPIAMLQACCGLRMSEAAWLRCCDVDFQAKSITVAKTPWHTPKNRSSHRTIPVPQIALDALQEHLDTPAPIARVPESPLFMSSRKRPYVHNSLVNAWNRAMVEAREVMPFLAGFAPRNLRAAFATAARRHGVDRHYLGVYLGHCGQDILTNHYEHVGPEQLASVVAAISAFWDAGNGNNLATPAARVVQLKA